MVVVAAMLESTKFIIPFEGMTTSEATIKISYLTFFGVPVGHFLVLQSKVNHLANWQGIKKIQLLLGESLETDDSVHMVTGFHQNNKLRWIHHATFHLVVQEATKIVGISALPGGSALFDDNCGGNEVHPIHPRHRHECLSI